MMNDKQQQMLTKRPVFLLVLIACVFVGCRDDVTSTESGVQACFQGYKQAILDGNGELAVEHVDSKTIRYYEKMRVAALHGKPQDVKQLSTVDKLMVLLLRHQMSQKELAGMDAKALFAHAVKQGWISRASVITNELGDIKFFNEHATGVHVSDGKPSSINWIFRREDGHWRLDVTSIFPIADQALKQIIRDSDQTEDEFLFSIVESATGLKMTETVWQPMAAETENQ